LPGSDAGNDVVREAEALVAKGGVEEERSHLQGLIFDEDCSCTKRGDTVKQDAIFQLKITLQMQKAS